MSVSGVLLPTDSAWLKVHGWLVMICALFTLMLGLDVWFQTLRARANLGVLWGSESAEMQSMLQQRVSKQCCLEEFPWMITHCSSAAMATSAV